MHHLVHFAVGSALFFVLFLVLLIAISIYFLPAFLAFATHHRRRWLIAVLNLFLGGTFVVWFVCLVWVWTGHRDSRKRDPDAYTRD